MATVPKLCLIRKDTWSREFEYTRTGNTDTVVVATGNVLLCHEQMGENSAYMNLNSIMEHLDELKLVHNVRYLTRVWKKH